jgi:hypothetical protein
MAPVDVASFDRRRPQAPAPFAEATVQNHIPALVREFMLEVEILFWLGARHDEDQVCHDRLRRMALCIFSTARLVKIVCFFVLWRGFGMSPSMPELVTIKGSTASTRAITFAPIPTARLRLM